MFVLSHFGSPGEIAAGFEQQETLRMGRLSKSGMGMTRQREYIWHGHDQTAGT